MLIGQSVFCQCLQLINRYQFLKIVGKHQSDRWGKRFSSHDHLVSMLFLQLSQSKSLQEVCFWLESTEKKISHLGMKQAPKKSTLSYANTHRNPEIFKEQFFILL